MKWSVVVAITPFPHRGCLRADRPTLEVLFQSKGLFPSPVDTVGGDRQSSLTPFSFTRLVDDGDDGDFSSVPLSLPRTLPGDPLRRLCLRLLPGPVFSGLRLSPPLLVRSSVRPVFPTLLGPLQSTAPSGGLLLGLSCTLVPPPVSFFCGWLEGRRWRGFRFSIFIRHTARPLSYSRQQISLFSVASAPTPFPGRPEPLLFFTVAVPCRREGGSVGGTVGTQPDDPTPSRASSRTRDTFPTSYYWGGFRRVPTEGRGS